MATNILLPDYSLIAVVSTSVFFYLIAGFYFFMAKRMTGMAQYTYLGYALILMFLTELVEVVMIAFGLGNLIVQTCVIGLTLSNIMLFMGIHKAASMF